MFASVTTKQLHAWRERCRLSSWDAAAAALGVSRRQMYRLQRGETPIDRTIELACEGYEARLSKGDQHG